MAVACRLVLPIPLVIIMLPSPPPPLRLWLQPQNLPSIFPCHRKYIVATRRNGSPLESLHIVMICRRVYYAGHQPSGSGAVVQYNYTSRDPPTNIVYILSLHTHCLCDAHTRMQHTQYRLHPMTSSACLPSSECLSPVETPTVSRQHTDCVAKSFADRVSANLATSSGRHSHCSHRTQFVCPTGYN